MELAEELTHLREEVQILRAALAEAGVFAMKRLPHDSREEYASSEYFQKMFMECAVESIKSQRSADAEVA